MSDTKRPWQAPLISMMVWDAKTNSSRLFKPHELRKAQFDDESCRKLIHQMKGMPYADINTRNKYRKYRLINGILYAQTTVDENPRLVIPKKFTFELIERFHQSPLGAHLGITSTAKKLSQRYQWPNMFTQISDYIRSCPVCQAHKPKMCKRNNSTLPQRKIKHKNIKNLISFLK